MNNTNNINMKKDIYYIIVLLTKNIDTPYLIFIRKKTLISIN